MFKAILWDNDGVLVNTESHYFAASHEALEEIGIELTMDAFRDLSLTAGRSVFELAIERGIAARRIDELRRWRNRRYAELLAARDCVIPGVASVLTQLRGRFRMAVVTSSRREHFDLIHRHNRLLGNFEFCLTREDYRHSKPHPEPYLSALARLGLTPEDCLVVEDSPRGLQAARAAGLACIVVAGPFFCHEDFSGAMAYIDDLRELPNLLP